MSLSLPNANTSSHKLLFGFLSLFLLLKIIHINVPLFHDELGVYGRALFYMLDNGPTMIPGHVDPEISRGHPLFFTFFISWTSAFFGGTYIAARAIILLLSIALLYTTFLLGKETGNEKIGLLAMVLLGIQPLFFAQSIMILPEIMLSLLGMLSVLFYLRNNYALYFVFACLLMMTKETALVIFAGIALNEWHKTQFKISLKLIATVTKWMLPLSSFVIFLVVQKIQHGWFLYPYHTELLSMSIGSILVRLLLSLVTLFIDQGRIILSIAIGIALWKMPKASRTALFNQYFFALALGLMMLLFSMVNYFMPRYFLLVLPLVMIGFANILLQKEYRLKHLIIYFVLILPFQYSFLFFRNNDDMGHLVVVRNMQKGIQELDELTQGKKVKVFAQFPEINALEEPRNGYTNNPNYILTTTYDDAVEYALISTGELLLLDKFVNNAEYDRDLSFKQLLQNSGNDSDLDFKLISKSSYFYNTLYLFQRNQSPRTDSLKVE